MIINSLYFLIFIFIYLFIYYFFLENGQKCNPTILVETIFNVEESDLSVYYKSIRNNIRSANFFTKASTQAGGNEIT